MIAFMGVRISWLIIEIRLRRIAEPTAEQKSVLRQLGLSLPERFELNRKCSADLTTA